jgi:hypothetical protein
MVAHAAGTILRVKSNVDLNAPGGIGDAYECSLPPGTVPTSWLSDMLGIINRPQTDVVVVKMLKPKFIQSAHGDAIQSFANEARALTRLQRTARVTPLLGFGTLEPGVVAGPGDLPARLCGSLEEFEAEVASAAGTGRLPFLLLGNVPFEWTALAPFTTKAFEPGCAPELRFAEAVQITLELLRFLDHAGAELGVYHFDMKLEHVAWREGYLLVIDWNWSQVLEPGLQEGVLYQDLRRLFVRVLYPLLTGRDIEGNEPSTVWGRIGDPGLYPDPATGLLPFKNVERLVDRRLRRWLSKGFETQERAFPTHAAAADELAEWLLTAEREQPLWPKLDMIAARCSEIENELLGLSEEIRSLRTEARGKLGPNDEQFTAELARLTQGLNRFRVARPVAVTHTYRIRPDMFPWTYSTGSDQQS